LPLSIPSAPTSVLATLGWPQLQMRSPTVDPFHRNVSARRRLFLQCLRAQLPLRLPSRHTHRILIPNHTHRTHRRSHISARTRPIRRAVGSCSRRRRRLASLRSFHGCTSPISNLRRTPGYFRSWASLTCYLRCRGTSRFPQHWSRMPHKFLYTTRPSRSSQRTSRARRAISPELCDRAQMHESSSTVPWVPAALSLLSVVTSLPPVASIPHRPSSSLRPAVRRPRQTGGSSISYTSIIGRLCQVGLCLINYPGSHRLAPSRPVYPSSLFCRTAFRITYSYGHTK